jgi:hypothetical protein
MMILPWKMVFNFNMRPYNTSQLHVIIFDEIDAIMKARGSGGDTVGVD